MDSSNQDRIWRCYSSMTYLRLLVPALLLLTACTPNPDASSSASSSEPGVIHPEIWPTTNGGVPIDQAMEARIDSILATMTTAELVAHTIQPDIGTISPEQFREYRFGSVLNGGNSAPGGDVRAVPEAWLELADEFWEASMDTSEGRKAIPLLWGTDAVHGHANILGATIFPHNIGLGAARNPDLIRQIGAITAKEIVVTGMDWTFAPTLAVVRNDRWGRSYEGYSEDPEIVKMYASALVEGLQGRAGSDEFFGPGRVLACAKHYTGDGGTDEGIDQGNNLSSETDFRDIHSAGYPVAIEAGVQNVMGSYSSWHGKKMHGHKAMITDVLKGRMAFNGFMVGDWNGHGQLPEMENTSSPAALLAGLDMYMAPDSWEGLYHNTLAMVESGEIPQERVEDAVRRILRVKMRMGLFGKPKPSERPFGGEWNLLGAEEHLEVARQAVRESMVLLKNNDGTLPLQPGARVLVTGPGAENIGMQCGGWTLSWQGTGNVNSNFPNGTTIWQGIETAVAEAGGSAELSQDGSYSAKPDVAVVVFGESPYAEFIGDVENLDWKQENSLKLLRQYREEGIRTVSLFLSGRPLWVNPELNASDAFVAAWWPGDQGAVIADLLVANADGSPNVDFRGKLSFSWPDNATPGELNRGDEEYNPLFAYGYGLTYSDDIQVAELTEESGLDPNAIDRTIFYAEGAAGDELTMVISTDYRTKNVVDARTRIGEDLFVQAVDRAAQEDARQVTWAGPGSLAFSGEPVDFSRQANGDMAIAIQYRVDQQPQGKVELAIESEDGTEGVLDATALFAEAVPGEWTQTDIKLSCFRDQGADLSSISSVLTIRSTGGFALSFSDIRLASNEGRAVCLE